MGEQGSICVQKKTIFMLTIIIFVMTTYLYNTETKNEKGYLTVANIEVQDVTNNDDIISEETKFAAIEVIQETDSGETDEGVIETQSLKNNLKDDAKSVIEKNVSHETNYDNVVPTEYSRVIYATSTAYCLCQKCCGKSQESPNYGRTASGYKIVPGTDAKVIAVDPNVIPLGSKVYVENASGGWDYGYAIAADTGSAISGEKVDLYMDTHEQALAWGRKNVKVYIVE